MSAAHVYTNVWIHVYTQSANEKIRQNEEETDQLRQDNAKLRFEVTYSPIAYSLAYTHVDGLWATNMPLHAYAHAHTHAHTHAYAHGLHTCLHTCATHMPMYMGYTHGLHTWTTHMGYTHGLHT